MIEPKQNDPTRFGQVVWLVYTASRKVVVLCLSLMVALVVVDVFGRSLLGSGLPGTVEINEYLLVIMGFLSIAQTHYETGHVEVNLLDFDVHFF